MFERKRAENDADLIKRKIIEKAHACGESTHLGGALSMVDLLAVLFGSVINLTSEDLESPERDIFILSKGHCVLGYYATMNHFGLMSDEIFSTFQADGSDLIAHPIKNLKLGIESSNGSLGQGLSFGLGIALGMRLDSMENRRVFVLLGDGECNEGSVWEAVASAAEFGVNNLVAIVDLNGLRNDGINSTHPSVEKFQQIWSAFGWNCISIDGHNHSEIFEGFQKTQRRNDRPSVILASTIKGKGISFMENNNDWHHNRVTTKTFNKIWEELDD